MYSLFLATALSIAPAVPPTAPPALPAPPAGARPGCNLPRLPHPHHRPPAPVPVSVPAVYDFNYGPQVDLMLPCPPGAVVPCFGITPPCPPYPNLGAVLPPAPPRGPVVNTRPCPCPPQSFYCPVPPRPY